MAGGGQEWHLVLGKAFRHLAFDLGAWLGQPVVVIAPPLFQPRLVWVGAVSDPMAGDGVEQLVVQAQARWLRARLPRLLGVARPDVSRQAASE